MLRAASAALPDEIPPLRPPLDELPPSFWEQYGAWIIVGAAALLVLIALLAWRLLRPKPAVSLPIEVQTRRELEALRRGYEISDVTCPHPGGEGRGEGGRSFSSDSLRLSRISRCLRRYLTVAFELPPEELTTAEFCRLIGASDNIGSDLAARAGDFLRRLDELKFAPASAIVHGGGHPAGRRNVASSPAEGDSGHSTRAETGGDSSGLQDAGPQRQAERLPPQSETPPSVAAVRALELVELGEARRAWLRRSASSAPAEPPPSTA